MNEIVENKNTPGFFGRAVEFFRDVKREVAKVTWPTRKETGAGTAVVIVMTIIAAIFFLVVDKALGWILGFVLGVN